MARSAVRGNPQSTSCILSGSDYALGPTSAPRPLPGSMDPATHNVKQEDLGATATSDSLVGFGLGTPIYEPAQAPSYTNFSPLFSSANVTGLPPVAPIALRAGTAAPIASDSTAPFFQPFSDGSGVQAGNSFLMDHHGVPPSTAFSYGSVSAPLAIPCKALAGMKRRRLDEFGTGMLGFSRDQPTNASVRFAEEVPLDSYPSGGFPVTFEVPHMASESMPYYGSASSTYSTLLKPPLALKQTSREPQSERPQLPDTASTSPESAMNAILKKSSGSSCHQCKNRRESRHLNFCSNRTRVTGDDKKKKICRKKFCDHCIIKFNYQTRLPPKNSGDWECPSCLGICVCAACRRKIDAQQQLHITQAAALATEIGAPPLSPTLMFAHKLFCNPDVMAPGAPDISAGLPAETLPFFSSAF